MDATTEEYGDEGESAGEVRWDGRGGCELTNPRIDLVATQS